MSRALVSCIWLLFALLLVASFTVDYLVIDLGIGPVVLRRLPELLIAALFAVALLARRVSMRVHVPSFALYLLMLVAVSIVVLALLGAELGRAAVGLRNLGRFAVLAMALANVPAPHLQRRILNSLVLVIVVQIPLAVYQWSVQGRTDDEVFGTVRSTGSMAILMLLVVIIVLSRVVFLHRRRLVFLLPFLALPPLLGEGKAFFLFMPLVLAMFYAGTILRRPLWGTVVVLAGALTFGYALESFGRVGGQSDLAQFLSVKLRNPLEDSGQDIEVSQRIRIQELAESFQQGTSNFGFGLGLGARAVFVDELDSARQRRSLTTTTAAVHASELGVWGLSIHVGMIIHIAWSSRRLAHRGQTEFSRFIGAVTAYTSVLMLAASFYTNLEVTPVACTYWTLVGLASAQLPASPRPARRRE